MKIENEKMVAFLKPSHLIGLHYNTENFPT